MRARWCCLMLLVCVFPGAQAEEGAGSVGLWEAYLADPLGHPHLPFVAPAGRRDAADGPVATVAAVDHGVVVGDEMSDFPALEGALAAARGLLNGEDSPDFCRVELPPGEIVLDDLVRLDTPGLILAGAGSGKTVIHFTRSLRELFELEEWFPLINIGQFSWRGGLVWVRRDPFAFDPPEVAPVAVAAPAEAGATRIRLARPLPPEWVGRTVVLEWRGDAAWRELVYGHAASSDAVAWEEWPYIDEAGISYWRSVHRIVARDEDGGCVLEKPLRLPIREAWQVRLGRQPGLIEDVGVEGITFAFPSHYGRGRKAYEHLEEPGYNGIFLQHAADCWVRDVAFRNSDAAVILEWSHHNHVADVTVAGDLHHRAHHGVSLRSGSGDNLVERVRLAAPVEHGLSVQDLAFGNVFRACRLDHGTIESHRGMPFDNVFTDIRMVAGDGKPGGKFGPYAGRRMVLWNVEVDPAVQGQRYNPIGVVFNPANHPGGALVGVRGVDFDGISPDRGLAGVPPGEKGAVVGDRGRVPEPLDLYEAQREAWTASD